MAQVFPEAEHRFCVRHLYQNFQVHFKGDNLKNQLWTCARSTYVRHWEKNMQKMKEIDAAAHQWLEQMAPNTWVRAFFSTFPKCDVLLNNNCEVFNKYILEARELPILSMLERIKNQIMTRHYNKQKEAENFVGTVCPKIRKKLPRMLNLLIFSMSCLLAREYSKCSPRKTHTLLILSTSNVSVGGGISQVFHVPMPFPA